MRKEESKSLKEKAEQSSLWLLEMRISRQNKLLIGMKSQGMSYKDTSWKNLCQKRNIYRNVVINKLLEWKKGKIEGANPTYNDYLEYQKDKENSNSEQEGGLVK